MEFGIWGLGFGVWDCTCMIAVGMTGFVTRTCNNNGLIHQIGNNIRGGMYSNNVEACVEFVAISLQGEGCV